VISLPGNVFWSFLIVFMLLALFAKSAHHLHIHDFSCIHGNGSHTPVRGTESSPLPGIITGNSAISDFVLCFAFRPESVKYNLNYTSAA
jgi:hypothetical protein